MYFLLPLFMDFLCIIMLYYATGYNLKNKAFWINISLSWGLSTILYMFPDYYYYEYDYIFKTRLTDTFFSKVGFGFAITFVRQLPSSIAVMLILTAISKFKILYEKYRQVDKLLLFICILTFTYFVQSLVGRPPHPVVVPMSITLFMISFILLLIFLFFEDRKSKNQTGTDT